ncbi:MAG: hypothetical protein BroJett029_31290 [Alphaproteobacteria bacterium]|nr:MAG: hypothetical protein BroJett029_31290 [Alphaproteobacteria bacterium]
MIELQRPIALPSPSGAGPTDQVFVRAAVAEFDRPVEPAAAVMAARGWQNGRAVLLESGGGDRAPGGLRDGRSRTGSPDLHGSGDETERSRARAGRLAFLVQQIYQEVMPTGLHREPWAEGIGAYRLAGAEPAPDSADPAVVRVSV